MAEPILYVLSGGAAKALVQDASRKVGFAVQPVFGAVGAVGDRFASGEACDVLILTDAIVAELTQRGQLAAGSARPLGEVHVAVAVPAGSALPDIGTAASLRASLLASPAVYVPDLQRSTAGSHLRRQFEALGIADALAERLHSFANGEAAMAAMLKDGIEGAVGLTQNTEILATPGLAMVGPLPAGLGLATVYTAAIATRAESPALAAAFIAAMTDADGATQRAAHGFVALPEHAA